MKNSSISALQHFSIAEDNCSIATMPMSYLRALNFQLTKHHLLRSHARTQPAAACESQCRKSGLLKPQRLVVHDLEHEQRASLTECSSTAVELDDPLCVDMWIDMCIDTCIDMWIDMWIDMLLDMCKDMCIEMWIDMSTSMCKDMCLDMCKDMCIHMCMVDM